MRNVLSHLRRTIMGLVGDKAFGREMQMMREEIPRQKDNNIIARRQRDEAREQRDEARDQRNAARRQRREAQQETKTAIRRMEQSTGSSQTRRLNYFEEVSRTETEFMEIKAANPKLENVSLGIVEFANGVRPPVFSNIFPERQTPPETVAFVTVANDLFVPGLEVCIASLLDVYPDFASDVIVFHDGSISAFCMERIRSLYAGVRFEVPDMEWLDTIPQDSANRKRIGILGYMSVQALSLEGYERVVIFDSDTAFIDDISMFWTGQDRPLGTQGPPAPLETMTIFACHDYGARPWAAISPQTKAPIVNSGILSVPKRYMTAENQAAIRTLVQENHESFCPLLDRFADQKAWNRFIYARDVQFLPINFNCNIKYLDAMLGGDTSFVRMIHFAGYKPWFDKLFINGDQIPESENYAVSPAVWRGICRRTLGRLRQRQYQRLVASPAYFKPVAALRHLEDEPGCFFIGNGPSLKDTDLARIAGFESFAFNWFVLHDDFDEIRPSNLVLASHMLFGGWHVLTPEIPPEYLDVLLSRTWRPTLWTSFYFREYFESTDLPQIFDIRYVLFEKPHKDFIDATGTTNLDMHGFVNDGRTGVLSAALPIALRKGYKRIGLVGCDSNYNQTSGEGSNYFYDAALHASKETRAESLTQTWTQTGPGHFAYRRAQESLQRRDASFIDFTLNGSLPLPKGDLADLTVEADVLEAVHGKP